MQLHLQTPPPSHSHHQQVITAFKVKIFKSTYRLMNFQTVSPVEFSHLAIYWTTIPNILNTLISSVWHQVHSPCSITSLPNQLSKSETFKKFWIWTFSLIANQPPTLAPKYFSIYYHLMSSSAHSLWLFLPSSLCCEDSCTHLSLQSMDLLPYRCDHNPEQIH